MTDEALRAAERAFTEIRSVATEAAFLRERLRARLLDRGRVELAAHAGHEASRALLGADAPPLETNFLRWYDGLERFGTIVSLHAAFRAAESVLPLWETRPDALIQHRGAAPPAKQIAAAARYLECPCDAHADAAHYMCNDVVGRDLASELGHVPWALAHDAADSLVWAITPAGPTLWLLRQSIERSVAARAATCDAASATDALRSVIERDLVAWSLA